MRYAGVNFRSRLEARWAAWFDIVGLKWEYEPFDTDAAYLPDFLVESRLLCEVRPIQWSNLYDDSELVIARAQISEAAAQLHLTPVVLGASIAQERGPSAIIGEIMAPDWRDLRAAWAFSWKSRPGEHVVKLDNEVEGHAPLRFVRCGHDFEKHWKEAGNRVQWAARQRTEHIETPIRRVLRRVEEKS